VYRRTELNGQATESEMRAKIVHFLFLQNNF